MDGGRGGPNLATAAELHLREKNRREREHGAICHHHGAGTERQHASTAEKCSTRRRACIWRAKTASKRLDHLRAFVESYRGATEHHHTEFYRLAWQLPCPVEEITARTSAYIQQLYNPDGRLSVAGFKEIRYGRAYDELCRDIGFLRQRLPELRIVFNTRSTDDAVNSEFWTENPTLSRQILDETRRNF